MTEPVLIGYFCTKEAELSRFMIPLSAYTDPCPHDVPVYEKRGRPSLLSDSVTIARADMDQINEAFAHQEARLQFFVDYMDERGMLGDDHTFTFPDGITYTAAPRD